MPWTSAAMVDPRRCPDDILLCAEKNVFVEETLRFVFPSAHQH
jgi:hypothetical protein